VSNVVIIEASVITNRGWKASCAVRPRGSKEAEVGKQTVPVQNSFIAWQVTNKVLESTLLRRSPSGLLAFEQESMISFALIENLILSYKTSHLSYWGIMVAQTAIQSL
jgi:hypothetical protein